MVLLLRILAILAALKGLGAMIVTGSNGWQPASILPSLGRVIDAGTPSLTLAVVTFTVASLVAAQKNSETKKQGA
jgi:hypothetical protein